MKSPPFSAFFRPEAGFPCRALLVFALTLGCFIMPGSLLAQPKEPRLALSLREAISLALAKNFDITIESFNPRLAEQDIRLERGAFDPALTAEGRATGDKTGSASIFFPGDSVQKEARVGIGFEGKLVTGTQYRMLLEETRLSTNSTIFRFNPRFEAGLTFSLTQPLLKNFGIDINRTRILVAQNSHEISLERFRERVIDVVSQVQDAYWDLVFAIADHKAKKESLELAKDLLRRNRIQVDAGTLAPIEIVEAEASVAAREVDVITSANEIGNAEDRLKRILNLNWETRIMPADEPAFVPEEIDLARSLRRSFKYRPDFVSAQLDIKSRRIQLNFAKNQLLPQVDLVGSLGLNGLDNRKSEALDKTTTTDFYSWEAGVVLRYPIPNRTARAVRTKRRLEVEQALIGLKDLEQKITEEVRRAVRQITAGQKEVLASRKARELAEKRLEAEEKKFAVGLATSRDVLEDQEDLTLARTAESKALVNYSKALVNLDRVTGFSLKKHRIDLGGLRKRSRMALPFKGS
ncbi:MAG: TolC family protein [Nitrospinota bacterium]